ncbi:MAG: hypothetical protein Q4G39_04960, partial [Brachymonas sp.]|nr:hypothetical protein [Brachymonas sp.]
MKALYLPKLHTGFQRLCAGTPLLVVCLVAGLSQPAFAQSECKANFDTSARNPDKWFVSAYRDASALSFEQADAQMRKTFGYSGPGKAVKHLVQYDLPSTGPGISSRAVFVSRDDKERGIILAMDIPKNQSPEHAGQTLCKEL